jgi:hypothetical protein
LDREVLEPIGRSYCPEFTDQQTGEARAAMEEGEAGGAEGGGVAGEFSDGKASEQAEGAVESCNEGTGD